MTKLQEVSVKISSLRAKIWTQDLPNKRRSANHALERLVWWSITTTVALHGYWTGSTTNRLTLWRTSFQVFNWQSTFFSRYVTLYPFVLERWEPKHNCELKQCEISGSHGDEYEMVGWFCAVTACSLVDTDRRFRGTCCHHQGGIKIGTACSSYMSVNIYQTPLCKIPEDSHLETKWFVQWGIKPSWL
jgi:hypothetical protein